MRKASANICGARIKQVRENLQMEQSELSAALSVDHNIKIDQSTISEIERGVRGVRDYELDAIARVLGVEPTWLLRGGE